VAGGLGAVLPAALVAGAFDAHVLGAGHSALPGRIWAVRVLRYALGEQPRPGGVRPRGLAWLSDIASRLVWPEGLAGLGLGARPVRPPPGRPGTGGRAWAEAASSAHPAAAGHVRGARGRRVAGRFSGDPQPDRAPVVVAPQAARRARLMGPAW